MNFLECLGKHNWQVVDKHNMLPLKWFETEWVCVDCGKREKTIMDERPE